MAKNHTFHCKDESATALAVQQLAQAIVSFYTIGNTNTTNTTASNSPPALFISLDGDLGAGKTTATRYLLNAMGYGGKVKSPTYSLCEEHVLDLPNRQPLHVFHFDLYRMQSPQEWQEAGLLEHFSPSQEPTLCIVEWPGKAEHTLPTMDLAITLLHPNANESELARTVVIAAQTAKGQSIVKTLASLGT